LPKEALRDRLARYRQITISVTGRKSGRIISIPVWFVLEDGKLYLLPVKGSETQWYKNAVKNPRISVAARDANGEFKIVPISDSAQVSAVVEKFRGKYGVSDVKKYYSWFDVAVLVQVEAALWPLPGPRMYASSVQAETVASVPAPARFH